MSVSLAAANVISMDSAVAAVLSGLDGVFTVKEKEKHTQSLLLSLGGSGYMCVPFSASGYLLATNTIGKVLKEKKLKH